MSRPLSSTLSVSAALTTMPLVPEASTPAPIPSHRIAMDLVMVTAPKPPGSRQLISPFATVFESAPAKVLQGAVRLHGFMSSPTPETQVRAACAEATAGHDPAATVAIMENTRTRTRNMDWLPLTAPERCRAPLALSRAQALASTYRGAGRARRFGRASGEGGGDRARQRADGEGLAQELVAAEVVAFALADIAGDEQHGEIAGVGGLEVADQLGAGHLGHDHVGNDEIEYVGLEQLDRLGAAAAGDRLVVEVLERSDGRSAHPRVVLDQQDPRAGDMGVGLGALLRGGVQPHRRSRGLGARQVDGNGGAAPDLAFDPDLAARLVGEAKNLAEPKAGALAHRLGGEEGFERALLHFGAHPAAGIGDADLHIIAGADIADLVGGDLHVAGVDAHHSLAVHRVAGVDREVENRMLELVRVDISGPGIGGEIDLDADALAERPVAQVGHPRNQLAAVDPLWEQRLGPGEGQQPAGQRGGPGRTLHRILQLHQHFAPRTVESALGQVDPADDDGEHIIEVVRDAAGELPDRLHLLHLAQLGFGRLALLRLRFQRLVGLPQFLGALAHGELERFRALGLAFGEAAGQRVLPESLERDNAEEHGPETDDDAEPAEIVGESVRLGGEELALLDALAKRRAFAGDDLIELGIELLDRRRLLGAVEIADAALAFAADRGPRGHRELGSATLVDRL